MVVGSSANRDSFKVSTPSDQEIRMTRLFDAPPPPRRLVFTEIFEQFPDTVSVVTADFTDEGGKTRFVATIRYPSLEGRDMVMSTGMDHGAGISYDRLEDLVAELQRS